MVKLLTVNSSVMIQHLRVKLNSVLIGPDGQKHTSTVCVDSKEKKLPHK